MEKKGNSILSGFNSRYFALFGGEQKLLKYYEIVNKNKSNFKGYIDIRKMKGKAFIPKINSEGSKNNQRYYEFHIVTFAPNRTWKLRVYDTEQRKQWINVINGVYES